MTMCVCRWTFLCVSFFLPTEAFGSCGRTFRPRCHCLDSSWRLFQKRSPALRGSPRDVTLPVCARISTIMIIRRQKPSPWSCLLIHLPVTVHHTRPQQSITHCRVHRFLQPYSQTSHSPVNTYCSAQNWKAVSGSEEGQLDAAATTKI